MKGNIGPSKKNTYIDPDEVDNHQKRIWRKLAEEFDIDNVIPVAQQRVQPSPLANGKTQNHSMQSFELDSAYEMGSNHGSSTNAFNTKNGFGPANTVDQGFFNGIPGLEDIENSNEDDDGLITSDSDFDVAVKTAGYTQQDNENVSPTKKTMNLKKDVTKTFKKMLTSNHKRLNMSDEKFRPNGSQYGDSTKYNGSVDGNRQDYDD